MSRRIPLSQPCPGRIRRWLRRGLFGATALGGMQAGWLAAQDAPGLTMRLDFGQGIEASTNPDLVDEPARDRVIGRTKLGFSLASETQTQLLTFGIGGNFEAGDFGGDISGNSRMANQRVNFGYTRMSRDTLIGLDARYSRTPVSDIEGFDEFTGEDLLLSGGERGTATLGLRLETGRESPVGFSLSGSKTEIRYYDAPVGGSSVDRDIWNVDSGLRLSVSRTLDVTLQAGWSGNSYDDARNYTSDSSYAGVGLSYEVDPGLRLTAGLRHNRIETGQNIGTDRITDKTDGLGGNLGFEMERPDGVFSGSLSSSLYDTGRRDMLTLGRSFELPDDGLFDVTASLVDTDNGSHVLLGGHYRHVFQRGTLNVSASQQVTSDEDEEAIRSQLALGWQGELTKVSRWNIGLSISDYDVTGGSDGTDSRRSSLTLGYAHDLTEAWALNAGYTHTLAQSDTRKDRDDNRLFLGVSSKFDFLP